MEIGPGTGAGMAVMLRQRVADAPTQAQAGNAAGGPAAEMVFGTGQNTPQTDAVAAEKAYAKVMNDKFAAECQTCQNRRYQDGSDDSSVSFQTPQHIDPAVSAAVVSSHEQEHVVNERAAAQREGGQVLSQSVVLHGANCPECGRYYIAGGTTTTITRSGGEQPQNSSGAHSHATSGASINLSV